jgi:hypothetical protein
MRVRELLEHLYGAAPDAVVLWQQPYSDLGEVDEISQVAVPQELWTCERHMSTDGHACDLHHPTEYGLSLAGTRRPTDNGQSVLSFCPLAKS